MDYKDFSRYLTGEFSELPLNRKERFFTGTVFPALLFHNGLSNFYRFLREIKNFPDEVCEEATKDNFLFYTDYNLKESAGGRNIGRKIPTRKGVTPDIVIEILEPKRVFVIVEAKMFHDISDSSLSYQMNEQREAIIGPLKDAFNLRNDQIFHVALVPERSGLKGGKDYQIIYWEFFIKVLDVASNYFHNYLKFALDNYPELVATGSPPPPYPQKSGRQIYEDGKSNGTLWVGRQGGAKAIIEDIKSGEWETCEYYVNQDKPSSGRKGNWITSKEFAELVDKYGKG